MYKTTAFAALLVAWAFMAQAAQDKVSGKFVNVSIPGDNKILSLAEVQVFSEGKNIAQGKMTVQTSSSKNRDSNLAVDGNTNGDNSSASFTHTAEMTTDPAWEINLVKTVAIEKVVIWNRDDFQERLHGVRVMVLDENRKVVWGADVAQPGPGATELAVKNHPAPTWTGTVIAKVGNGRFSSTQSGISLSTSTKIITSYNNPHRAIGTDESLRLAINDLIAKFGNRYPKGKGFLDRLDALKDGDSSGLEKLSREALLANPLLDFEKLLVIKRRGDLGLPQNWVGNCTKKGRYDNEIALLPNVREGGELTTLFRPEKDVFVGDVDLHWDAEKMLFSMPAEHNRYQVFEVGIDGEGLRQVSPTETDIDNYDACYLPSEKKQLRVFAFDYHYLGCGKTMALIGKAFAEAILDIEARKD